ncbi:ATP-binding protein [Algibacter sp. AS12]|uniref:hybrid sensor histidine kinase/response regulator n=1 Tax=Algibacter sp. AS12 TaxID=3135773 RepID=UPI00398B7572
MKFKSLNINLLLTRTPYKELSKADQLTFITYSIGLLTGLLIYILNAILHYETPKSVAIFVVGLFFIAAQLYFNFKKQFLSSVIFITCASATTLYLCYNVGLTTSYFMYSYVLLCAIPFLNKRNKNYLQNSIILALIVLLFTILIIVFSPQYNTENLAVEHANNKLFTNSILSFTLFIIFSFILVVVSSNVILALIKAKKNAEIQMDKKTRVLSNLGHELRTQLSSVHGITQLILDQNKKNELDADTFSEHTETLELSSKQMLFLVNDILDIHKIESGNFTLNSKPENLNNLLNKVVTPFKNKALEKKLVFEFSIDPVLKNFYVNTDASRLTQVLQNLISNAIKYTDKGYVKFSAKIELQTIDFAAVQFSVKDSGIGIAKENLRKVFHSFHQIRDKNSLNIGGTGLGLAISKTIIEKMNSQINVISSPKEGSDFYFVLKLNKVLALNETENQISNTQITTSILKGKKILIAEDNKISMLYASKLLENNGAKVLKAYNGIEAVQIAKEHPDLSIILMDLEMPGMNGFTAVKHIKKLDEKFKIIAFTANIPDDNLIEKINALNFDGILAKPFKNEDMFLILHEHLSK